MRRRRPGLLVLAALTTAATLAGCGTTVSHVSADGTFTGADGLSTAAPSGGAPATGSEQPGTITGPGSVTGGGPAVGGSTGSTTVSGPGATAPGSGSSVGTVGGIPATGRGWDAKSVYVGIPTADDFNSVVKGLGANFSNGDVHGDIDAIVADINKGGGILGRTLVPVYHDTGTVELSSNPSGVAQSMCSYFTQDRPVVAVINGSPQLDAQASFHQCLQKKQTTLLTLSNTDFSDADYGRLGPNLFTVGSLSTDILVPTMVSALHEQGYFSGWDTALGAPGKNPAKVGLLLPETAQGHHVGQVFRASLKRIGVEVVSDFFYDAAGTGSKSQSEVLRFSSAKVTHVLDLPPIAAEIYFFQGSAEQQHYRPRYGFTSMNLPLSTEENAAIASPAQQVGSMGIGWQPYNDTNAAHDAGAMPGSARCFAALKQGGQTFAGTQRRAAFVAGQLCDSLYLLRDALVAGKGLTAADVLRAMPSVGPRFAPAATFRSTLSAGNNGVPGYFRSMAYVKDCSCFTYVGGKQPFRR